MKRHRWFIAAAVVAVYGLSEGVRWYMEQLSGTSLPLWGAYGALSALMLVGTYYLTISAKKKLAQVLLFSVAAIFLIRTANAAIAIYHFSAEVAETAEDEPSPDLIEV